MGYAAVFDMPTLLYFFDTCIFFKIYISFLIPPRHLKLLLKLDYCSLYMEFLLQLRNLVWATSKHDVYLMSHFSVLHWSSLTSTKSEVLNVSGHVAPCEVSNLICGMYSQFLVICVCVRFPGIFRILAYLESFLPAAETPWEPFGRIYSDSGQHTSSER